MEDRAGLSQELAETLRRCCPGLMLLMVVQLSAFMNCFADLSGVWWPEKGYKAG